MTRYRLTLTDPTGHLTASWHTTTGPDGRLTLEDLAPGHTLVVTPADPTPMAPPVVEYWCAECWQPIVGEDPHTNPTTGGDVHLRCCVVCDAPTRRMATVDNSERWTDE